MKKLITIILTLTLLVPTMLFADSVKYTSSAYATYNAVFTNSEEFKLSPLTFGLGIDSSTFFLNDKNNGFGISTKFDIGFDIDNDKRNSMMVLVGPSYQYTINKNVLLSCCLGPSLGFVSNMEAGVNDSALAFGGGLDIALMLQPSPLFGFNIGATGYILPLGGYSDVIGKRPQIYSVTAYCGFVFSYSTRTEDAYYLPVYAPAEVYLNYQL